MTQINITNRIINQFASGLINPIGLSTDNTYLYVSDSTTPEGIMRKYTAAPAVNLPSPPTALSYNSNTDTLSWTSTSPSFSVTDLNTNISFSTTSTSTTLLTCFSPGNVLIVIRAIDASGNQSATAGPINITLGGVSAPTGLFYNVSTDTLSWNSTYFIILRN